MGESSTNMVTPLNQYFAIILGFMLTYNKKAGIGTLMSLMIPYTIVFLIAWILLMLVFVLFNIPIGPGVHLLIKIGDDLDELFNSRKELFTGFISMEKGLSPISRTWLAGISHFCYYS
ncbi:AbgT family transporter [Ureibacillus sp. BA0131]|uniref:AbgT family transporter n=1 Tax=Ureibacillus aquaedulcis TaxID=3058421 RepID=A0ABT8GQT0_9BACL|nr:AbgT family transporter [Ureibacillus sp. BA0131]MDN4493770.1 AbgT family transporter [Ureibacillus sp. BA0131]